MLSHTHTHTHTCALPSQKKKRRQKSVQMIKKKIIEEVRKYPKFFDKAHSDYKDKRVADNDWQHMQQRQILKVNIYLVTY